MRQVVLLIHNLRVVTRAEALAAVGRILARARVRRDALPVLDAARAAYVAGGPSVEDLARLIQAQRDAARTVR